MRKIGMWVGAAMLALALAGCDVTPGGSCGTEGAKATNKNGYSYTCTRVINPNGRYGRLIWEQDAPLKKDRP